MQQSKWRFFLPVVFCLSVWACGGPYYFDLHLENQENPGPVKLDKVLLIEDAEINQTYQDQRIVYRGSPFQVKYYNYRLWSKPPDDLIEDAVVDFWRKSGIFKKVYVYGSGDDGDLVLRMRINVIEKYYFQKKWYARLAMDLEIVDSEKRQTIVSHSFDQKMILRPDKVRFLPEKISGILHEELAKIAAKLEKENQC